MIDIIKAEIANPNPKSTINSYRSFGYNLSTAVSDIIDNSISANADEIRLEYKWNGKDSFISICDNGIGMNKEELVLAMTPGSKDPEEERNENDLEIYKIAVDSRNRGKKLNYAELPQRLIKHSYTESFTNRLQVVNGKGISHTVVAHISMDGHYYIHPDKKQNRTISVREVARIQSFPDDYFVEGSRTAALKQIGNAVPVFMAEKIAEKINELLWKTTMK